MPLDGGAFSVKPGQWDLSPERTAAPWLWRYNPIVYPFWQGTGEAYALNGRRGLLDINASWVSTPFGRALYTDGSADGNVHLNTWSGGSRLTLIWLGRFRTAASAIENITAADSGTTGQRVFQLRRSNTGVLQFIPFVGNSPITAASTTTIGTAPICLIGRNDGANASVFVGKPTPEGTIASGNLDTDAATWTLGGRQATFAAIGASVNVSESANIDTGILIAVPAGLSNAECARIIADPYACIRERDDTYIPAIFGDLPAGGGPDHELTAGDITAGAPAIDAAELSQGHSIAAADIAAGVPALDAAALSQGHGLTAADIVAGVPLLDPAGLSQAQSLDAGDILAGTPALDAAALSQGHGLAAADILAGSPALEAAELDPDTSAPDHALTAGDILAGAPGLDAAVLTQAQVLAAADIAAGVPALDAAMLTQGHGLAAGDVLAGTPYLDAAVLAQGHAIVAGDILSGVPFLDAAVLSEAVPEAQREAELALAVDDVSAIVMTVADVSTLTMTIE